MESEKSLMTEQMAAEFLRCSQAALRRWRREERGPAYYRVGRLVRYNPTDIGAFLESQRIESNTQQGGQ